MRWHVLLILLLALAGIWTPVSAAALPAAHEPPQKPGLTISANPAEARVGDTVTLNGTVTGISTIAVYLYVTSPDLDPRGVALENLNIAAGRGLFTTAPVKMSDGTWSYTWDTSVIIGNLRPGTYSVYVVASPLDRLRSNPQETAVTEVRFAPAERPPAETPLSPVVAVMAPGIAAILVLLLVRQK